MKSNLAGRWTYSSLANFDPPLKKTLQLQSIGAQLTLVFESHSHFVIHFAFAIKQGLASIQIPFLTCEMRLTSFTGNWVSHYEQR